MSARPPWAAASGPRIRHADANDRDALAGFLGEMDAAGLYQRHFAHGEAPNLALLGRLDAADGRDRVVMLAVDSARRVVGHAEYVAGNGEAEFALMVLPNWRDCGIGQALLGSLVAAATDAGLRRLHGMIQATNTRALQVARKRGFGIAAGDDATTVIVSRSLAQQGVGDPTDPACAAPPAVRQPNRHDPDRVPLHRRPGP